MKIKKTKILITVFVVISIFFSGCVTGTGTYTDTVSGVEKTADGSFGSCQTWKVYFDHDNGLPARNENEEAWDGKYSLDSNDTELRKFLQEASINKRKVTIYTEDREFTGYCKYHGKTVIVRAEYAPDNAPIGKDYR